MKFAQRDEGNYRIYAGALETPRGPYRTSLVIMRTGGLSKPTETYREELLPRTFTDSQEALEYAMKQAHRALVRQLRAV